MAKFNIGDRARIAAIESINHPELVGEITTITGGPFKTEDGQTAYAILMPPETGVTAATEEVLRPIYDGDEPVSWESCVWRPQPVSAA